MPSASWDQAVGGLEIDSSTAHSARVYDYFLGGDANFAVDRAAAEQAATLVGGMDRIRAEVRANRAFLGRSVRYLIREAGIRQFLDVGAGLPNDDNVHAVAHQEAPEARVVYVDKDPVVLAHAHVLLADTPSGSTLFIQDDTRHPERVLQRAATVLDLDEPVAVMLVGLLHLIRDDEQPAELVARLMGGVAPGSQLVVSHLAGDIDIGYVEAGEHLDQEMAEPLILRTHDQVASFFAGLDLVPPGVVQVDRWRPDIPPAPPAGPEGWTNPLYAGVGRKPD